MYDKAMNFVYILHLSHTQRPHEAYIYRGRRCIHGFYNIKKNTRYCF